MIVSQQGQSLIVFSDINPDVIVDSPYELVYNEESIRKSLETIFTTPLGSRPFNRNFGCKLSDLLFDPIDTFTATQIGRELVTAAKTWENRINTITISCVPDYIEQQYYVEVSYTIPQLGNKMVQYKFNVSKG